MLAVRLDYVFSYWTIFRVFHFFLWNTWWFFLSCDFMGYKGTLNLFEEIIYYSEILVYSFKMTEDRGSIVFLHIFFV